VTTAAVPATRPRSTTSQRSALVLSGGGARGAYQVGVLRGLLDLGVLQAQSPFEILVGASAGSLNVGMLASNADRFGEGVLALERIWSTLRAEQVFRTDLRSLSGIGARWVRDLSFGGVLRHTTPKSLLDTAPLRDLIVQHIPFGRIDTNIDNGVLDAAAVLATDLYTSHGVVFLHGRTDIPIWRRSWLRVERVRLGPDHLMASSAIPIFFPSVDIEGRHFGDGCIRNTRPLSPAINLGADRLVVIGVRGSDRPIDVAGGSRRSPPTVAQIAGVLLDSVMLDAIEIDVEHSERVNTSVLSWPTGNPQNPFRAIEVLWLNPSRSFRAIAAELSHHVPRIVRYLMRGLGTDESTTELVSYLLFHPSFCGRLIELGRADVAARQEEIRAFFARGAAATAAPAPAAALPRQREKPGG
jgi:NTE family protein